ncbi:amino acid ABC transporter ATP-binding protein [Devosia sp. BK]|jgi:polar amino acid transport system ATP-binding protein|uniref:amino acid ABC transporter ATP-binding protein n=1 Tax=unclassified Devosia TaxID=196773 RepID=UPI000716396C|nr:MULTISPECIES: amino acid ABC transporter ATP-binding protein [unclassified Devosia]KQN72486.1 peptide ABC transporter ATP-binding protein [Devosia sp. Leaf64]MDV3251312.1 amino acid ABC transporter ATP-binding protein [Devosia sp. BK]
MNRIEIDKLTKFYGERLVLDGIDLSVAHHEVVCLIGASGSGKSTLLRCINGLTEFDEGAVRLDGMDIYDESFGRTGLYKRIGIVFQAYNLFPHLTVLDNITLAPVRVHGRQRAEAEDAARKLLDLFGLGQYAKSYPEQLSGGQQQRVAVIRSLATDPEVLLLDEVTAALDPELIGEVLKIIRDLKTQGMTMVIVTHEMAFARDVADRVCFLDAGRIIEEAHPQRLFSSPENPRTQKFLERIIASGRLGASA